MIEYAIDETEHLIRVWMTGSNRCEDLKAHYARVLKDPRYEPTLDSLFQVDGDAGGSILTELPEVKTVIEMLAQCQAATRWAVVMPAGFKRTIVEYLLRGANLRSVTMRFFANETGAVAWLNTGRTPPIAASRPDSSHRASRHATDKAEGSPIGRR